MFHVLVTALMCSCDAFRLYSSNRLLTLSAPGSGLYQDQGQLQSRFIQELARARRQVAQELVRAQPHLVHDMGWPEIYETGPSQTKIQTNSSITQPTNQNAAHHSVMDDNQGVEDEMERMVHLAVPRDSEDYRGQSDPTDPETELPAGDTSLEASGFYGTDTEERDRGDEGAEDRERRGQDWDMAETSEGEKETEKHGVHFLDELEVNHTSPGLDALIGYSPSLHESSHEANISNLDQDKGPQEHRASPVLEVAPLDKELWETEDSQSSGYGSVHSSTAAPVTSSPPTSDHHTGTSTPETDTGTDFSLLPAYKKGVKDDAEAEHEKELEEDTGLPHISVFRQKPTVPSVPSVLGMDQDPTAPGAGLAPSREPLQPSVQEELEQLHGGSLGDSNDKTRLIIPLTTDPSPTVGFTQTSWDWLDKTTPPQPHSVEVGGVTDVFVPDRDLGEVEPETQVVCIDWTELAGRGYVVLNMTKNLSCEEFRADKGVRLLRTLERVFARRMNSPEGSWVLYLSKPVHQQRQLLMNVASEHGVIATKDVLDMLGEIRKSLDKVGIQNYSAASSCQSRPSQTRSDYGKLFVVLVIIGSVCTIIITSGFIYICWQRRLPAKTTFRAEELHFVENGCHDNPTLDVTDRKSVV